MLVFCTFGLEDSKPHQSTFMSYGLKLGDSAIAGGHHVLLFFNHKTSDVFISVGGCQPFQLENTHNLHLSKMDILDHYRFVGYLEGSGTLYTFILECDDSPKKQKVTSGLIRNHSIVNKKIVLWCEGRSTEEKYFLMILNFSQQSSFECLHTINMNSNFKINEHIFITENLMGQLEIIALNSTSKGFEFLFVDVDPKAKNSIIRSKKLNRSISYQIKGIASTSGEVQILLKDCIVTIKISK